MEAIHSTVRQFFVTMGINLDPALGINGYWKQDASGTWVNLASEPPSYFSRFERLIEVVTGDEDDRASGRARWRFYRDRGYPIQTHDLAAAG